MKIDMRKDAKGQHVPRQYIVTLNNQIFMKWLDDPHQPLFMIPADIPIVEIELDYIFFFKEMADDVANEISGSVIEIVNEQYERILLNKQVSQENQLEEVHRSIQKNSLKQQILAAQLQKKKEFRDTFFPMSEEATDKIDAAIHGAESLLQMEGFLHEEQASHRHTLQKFRKQFDAEIEEMEAKEQELLEEEEALFSLRKKIVNE
ncbi:hypothetical protein HCJ66_10990 [Listeria sp. FSL L7-1582]|uniref:hypothetical protein n=1 Tax=Listeria portnoyi TaxID=2713504 RepID=UPI00164DAE52|nr:hypothetical protein [Listeria portnoyi]MBC6310065.1 hypothetical protein [Listeria portnoyi]